MRALFCLFVVLIAAAQVRSSLELVKWKDNFNQCKSETGVTDDIFKKLDVEDKKLNCFQACMMKKSGRIVEGKIVLDKEVEYKIKYFPGSDDLLKQSTTECVSEGNKKLEECEVAGVYSKCFREKMKESLD